MRKRTKQRHFSNRVVDLRLAACVLLLDQLTERFRRFVDADITDSHRLVATAFVLSYAGSDEYLTGLHARLARGLELTKRQASGALNVLSWRVGRQSQLHLKHATLEHLPLAFERSIVRRKRGG